MLKAIHTSGDIVAAREKAVRVIEKLRGLRLNRAAELAEAAVEETLTYYAFPEGTVRNSVCEATMMEGKGASYGYREGPAGPTFSWA